jgi:hypothetical protein
MMNRTQSPLPLRRSQKGLVSITVTLVLMLVISLVVLGFAQVSRREQRQSLDRQLSTQAFFAAESGVNDALDVIRRQPFGTNLEKQSCDYDPAESSSIYSSLDPVIDTAGDIKYTCLLVTTAVDSIKNNLTPNGSSAVYRLEPQGGSLSSIHLSWKTNAATVNPALCTGSPTFFANNPAAWRCPYGVIRIDIVPLSDLKRGDPAGSGILGNQRAYFLYPTNSGSSTFSMASTSPGSVKNMNCSAAECSADITGFTAGTNYALRTIAVYQGGLLEISARNGATPVDLLNAQAQIDATGKAQDVLRRIEVRVALVPSGSKSNYAIESGSAICKRFGIAPGYFTISGVIGQDPKNPMCTDL